MGAAPTTHPTHDTTSRGDGAHLPARSQSWDLLAFAVAVPGSMTLAFVFALSLMLANGGLAAVGWTLGAIAMLTLLIGIVVAAVGSLYERASA